MMATALFILAIITLWEPVDPRIYSLKMQLLGPEFTLLYPDSLSAMTFLPSYIPAQGGMWLQSNQKTILAWKSGFFVGFAGDYRSDNHQSVDTYRMSTDISDIGNYQLLFGKHLLQNYGILLFLQDKRFSNLESQTSDTSGDVQRVSESEHSPKISLGLSIAQSWGYIALYVGQRSYWMKRRSILEMGDTSVVSRKDDTLSIYTILGVKGTFWGGKSILELNLEIHRPKQFVQTMTSHGGERVTTEESHSYSPIFHEGIQFAWLKEYRLKNLRLYLGLSQSIRPLNTLRYGEFAYTGKLPVTLVFHKNSWNFYAHSSLAFTWTRKPIPIHEVEEAATLSNLWNFAAEWFVTPNLHVFFRWGWVTDPDLELTFRF